MDIIVSVLEWYFLECGFCLAMLYELMMTFDQAYDTGVPFFKTLVSRITKTEILMIVFIVVAWPLAAYKFFSVLFRAYLASKKKTTKQND
jgi:hypothetical protein